MFFISVFESSLCGLRLSVAETSIASLGPVQQLQREIETLGGARGAGPTRSDARLRSTSRTYADASQQTGYHKLQSDHITQHGCTGSKQKLHVY